MFGPFLEQRIPGGVYATPTGIQRIAGYRPASQALQNLRIWGHQSKVLDFKIDEAGIAPAVAGPLMLAWREFIQRERQVSRAERRSTTELPTGAALKLSMAVTLPVEAKARVYEQARQAFQSLLDGETADGSVKFVPVSRLAVFCGCASGRLRSQAGASQVAEMVQYFGLGIEPDPAVHARGWSDSLVAALFPLKARVDSPDHPARCALVQMAAFVLRAANETRIAESEAIQEIVAPVRGLPDEPCLLALAKLFERNPSKEIFRPTRVVGYVPEEKRAAIAKALVRVAVSDNFITTDEENALWTLFHAMGITAGEGRRLFKASGALREAAGASRPPAGTAAPDTSLHLDPELLRKREAETSEVGAILAKAMQEASEEAPNADQPEETPEGQDPSPVPQWLAGLEPMFVPIIQDVIQRDSWPRQEFEELARNHKQMAGAVIDAINLWADEALGDVLLTGEDPIAVNQSLLPSPHA
jgi:uncharacterized tellurite resistance protein B-like protein